MSEELPKLVFVGLGNPGKRYSQTRHNLGFMVIEAFANSLGWTLKEERRFFAMAAKGVVEQREVHLLFPQTYMNESGWSVRHFLDYHKWSHAQLVVVCDDTAIDFGHLRVRCRGSAGGHNGLKSVIAHVGTEEFVRIRMGIGKKQGEQSLADYVLSNFSSEEVAGLDGFVKRGVEVMRLLIIEPTSAVMNRVNVK